LAPQGMINKFVVSVAEALSGIEDGATVLIGGFGAVGQPDALIEGLIERGVRELAVVANNAGYGRVGLARLLAEGRVRKLICSYPRIAGSFIFEELYKAGKIELELNPQGTLAERLRAAGAGVPAFFTATGAGTLLAKGKETRLFNGREHVLETALHGDVALVDAWAGDRWGNLIYRSTSRNFNPVMATAARLTVAQVRHRRELGELDPEAVVTPGVYVHRVLVVDEPSFSEIQQVSA
jgi:3-oxoadipate CoA-transferase alpha subunit